MSICCCKTVPRGVEGFSIRRGQLLHLVARCEFLALRRRHRPFAKGADTESVGRIRLRRSMAYGGTQFADRLPASLSLKFSSARPKFIGNVWLSWMRKGPSGTPLLPRRSRLSTNCRLRDCLVPRIVGMPLQCSAKAADSSVAIARLRSGPAKIIRRLGVRG